MMRYCVQLVLMVALSLLCSFQLQAASIEPGSYLTEGGWGDLTIKRGKDGKTSFKLFAIGSNAHMCDLSGEIHNGVATLTDNVADGSKPCVIRFTPKGAAIEVQSLSSEECRYYCGMRAGFEGSYVRPTAACTPAAISKSRKEFKKLYDKKAYAEAVAALEPVLKNCSKTMHWLDVGWVRNDLALTHAKLGHQDACQQLLQPLSEDAAKSDEQIRDNYPPSDAESYLPIVKATRTNLKLCRSAKTKK